MSYRIWKIFTAVTMATLLISACSGGSEGTGLNNPVNLEGSISAPGGVLAFNKPSLWQRMFASVFGKNAVADISGVTTVGAGVTVNLIEVDVDGNQVGDVIASGTTDALGEYIIEAPEGFTPGSQYVIRAGTSETIDARVASTTVDVNPITDAVSRLLITKVSDLDAISTTELQEFITTLGNLTKNIDPTGLSAVSLSIAMQTEANNNNESSNVIASASATGQICGTVTNAMSVGLENIRIVARDYGDWVTRAKTTTASDGSYCLNVPKTGDIDSDSGSTFSGEYILGAINRTGDGTDPDRSASEWWTASGVGYSQFSGEKITVTNTTTVAKDFQLENGARISGRVSELATSNPLEGVEVIIRSFESRAPVASARAKADGTYQINVPAGTEDGYVIETRNSTVQAFASETYDGSNGSNNRNHGVPVTLTPGQNQTINFELEPGYRLSGVITDGIGGDAVTGRRVMVNLRSGGSAVRLRTNKIGNYSVWLAPDIYNIYAYGQRNIAVNMIASNQVVNFQSATVSSITATFLHNSLPVRQAKVRLYTAAGAFINMEPSNSDGSVTVYTAATGNFLLEARIDRRDGYGTIIYDNDTRLRSGQVVTVASTASEIGVGDIDLPVGGVLTGTVTSDGINPISNFRVAVWNDNDLSSGVSSSVTSDDYFTQMRTRGDGSFVVTLPVGIYDRVTMRDASLGFDVVDCGSITIVADETTTVNYNDGSDTCTTSVTVLP